MINRLLSFFLCALLMFPSCTKQDRKCIAQQELQQFYNCSTIDWAKMDTLYYRPYNCDWPDEIGAQIHPDFPPEYSAKYWHRLQNAKTYLHQQTLRSTSRECKEHLIDKEKSQNIVYVSLVLQSICQSLEA